MAKLVDVDTLSFVSPPPEYLHLKCPICLELLTGPHLVVCCGNHICGSCINKLGNRPCPLCKSVKVGRVPDKAHERALNSLRVYCPNHESGCHWSGEIKELSHHISKEDGDCQFELFSCKYGCGDEFLRPLLSDHETNSCCKRPLVCKYCQTYKSTSEHVTSVHYRVCSSFPVSCPNGCGSSIKRNTLDRHLSEGCALRKVACQFASMGCKWFNCENTLGQHLESSFQLHVSLASQFKHTLLCRQVTDLSKQNIELKQENVKLCQQVTKEEIPKVTAEVTAGISLEEPVDEESDEESDDESDEESDDDDGMLTSKGTYVHIQLPEDPIDLIVDRWTHKRDHNNIHNSTIFGVDIMSTTMQVTVHCNGIRDGYRSHVSVCANIQTSDMQSLFSGKLLITLLSVVPGYEHKYGVIIFDDTVEDCYRSPSVGCAGLGVEEFIGFEELDFYLSPDNDGLSFEIQYLPLSYRY